MRLRDGLAANNVRHILNVATGIPNAFPNVHRTHTHTHTHRRTRTRAHTHTHCAPKNGYLPPCPQDYTYRTVAMRDDEETQLRPSLDQCFQFIDEAMATGGGVLVHWYVAVAKFCH